MKRNEDAFALIELLAVLAIIGILSLVAIPSFDAIRRKAMLRGSVHEVRSVMRLARSRAISRSANSAIKFRMIGDEWHYALFDDGDGDGVRNDDIVKGIDPRVTIYERVFDSGEVRIGLPSFPVRDPDTKKLIAKGASPVRFNSSTLCSFGRLGGGTAGSIFLTDGNLGVAMVRVTGASGRVRAIVYDRGAESWGKL